MTDGKFLRPIDEPVKAPVEFDWCTSLCEALTYRPELRQERWEVKKKELALAYSKNGLLPELNATLLYRWLGLGNKFGSSDDGDTFPSADSAALNDLYQGNYQEGQFGLTFAMPVGFRRELANVRNAQLKLARELARVEDMELDISKELTEAFRALAANQMIMQSSFNRWKDTSTEEQHFDRLEDAGVATLDVALDAQRRRSQAEIAFYTALCEYNKVIALIHRRKGTILAYSGICFAEGPWPGKAYVDAQEHARRRGASRQINYGWSRPQVISRGENWPSGENIGNTPMAYAKSATDPIPMMVDGFSVAPISDTIHTAPMNGMQIEGSIPFDGQTVPYYHETPVYQNSPAPMSVPTPIKNSSLQSPIQSGVRQVAYVDEIPAIMPTKTVEDQPNTTTSSRKRQSNSLNRKLPRKPSVQPAVPKRDSNPQPTQRLKAQTPMKTNSSNSARSSNAQSDSTGVLRTGNLAWEKLGLERPTQSTNETQARIRVN